MDLGGGLDGRSVHRRLLLRTPKSPFEVVDAADVFRHNLIGANSGNLVFLQAAWKLLDVPGVTLEADHLRPAPCTADVLNERFDAYVIPLANAFRMSFESQLVTMTGLIRHLRIPVVILGVGAQGTLDGQMTRLAPISKTVKAFVAAVLDHAPSIGVRGELTHDYLQSLGFRDVEIVGCPSMFLWGDRLRVDKRLERLDQASAVSINVSPYVRSMGPIVMGNMTRYPRLTYVPQDLETLGQLLFGAEDADAGAPTDIPVHRDHPLFTEDRVRFYVEPWPWIDALRSMDFSFGTRIHGNIAAILAGTPAVVLAHDSRTLELARHFGIPYRLITDADADLDAADLYAAADFTSLNAGHAARFADFQAYLRRHGLLDTFAHGDAGRAFEARIADTPFQPAVTAGGGARRRAHSDRPGGDTAMRVRRRMVRLARTSGLARRARVIASHAKSHLPGR